MANEKEMNDFSKVTIRNAKLHFRNFSGKESEMNKLGDRNFCVELDPEIAKEMKLDGWNVKQFKPKEDSDEEPPYYIQVKVVFKYRPPKIVLKKKIGEDVTITEDNVNMLDWVEMDKVDLIFVKHHWTYGSRSGINAYLRTMYVTVSEDELESEYENDEAGDYDKPILSTDELPFD